MSHFEYLKIIFTTTMKKLIVSYKYVDFESLHFFGDLIISILSSRRDITENLLAFVYCSLYYFVHTLKINYGFANP